MNINKKRRAIREMLKIHHRNEVVCQKGAKSVEACERKHREDETQIHHRNEEVCQKGAKSVKACGRKRGKICFRSDVKGCTGLRLEQSTTTSSTEKKNTDLIRAIPASVSQVDAKDDKEDKDGDEGFEEACGMTQGDSIASEIVARGEVLLSIKSNKKSKLKSMEHTTRKDEAMIDSEHISLYLFSEFERNPD